MEATILLARRPADANGSWLRRSLLALAHRFRDARVRLLVADDDAMRGAAGAARPAPPPASFDTMVLIERPKARWTAPAAGDAPPRDDALAWLAGAQGHRGRARDLRARAAPPRTAERSAGLVYVATVVRAPQLAPEAFDAHWRDRHAPLALRHHAGLSGYEQIAITSALTARAGAIDGVALLHFPSDEAFAQRFYDDDAGRDAITADTRSFLDLARCEAALMSEYGVRA